MSRDARNTIPAETGPATAPWIGRAALFAVVALVAVTCLGGAILYRQTVDQRVVDARRSVQVLQEHADKIIGGHLATLEQTEWLVRAQDWSTAAGRRQLHERLQAIDEAHPEVHALWVFDARGDVVATSEYADPAAGNVADRDFFRAAERGEDRFVGPVMLGRATGQYSFTLMRRIDDDAGGLLGVVIVSLRPEYFSEFYSSLGRRADSVMLLRESGALLARYPRPTGDLSKLRVDSGFMAQLASSDGASFRAPAPFGTGDYLFAARRVRGLPLYVVYGVAERRILADWLDRVQGYGLLAVPALLGVGGLGWVAYRQARRADQARRSQVDINRELERRVAERTTALAENEQVLRAAIEAAELGTWEIDIASGYSRWSSRMSQILGLPPDRTEATRPERVAMFHADDRPQIAAGLDAHIERGEPYRMQFRFVRPNGDVRWLASFGNTLPATGDKPARIVGVIQDVTERRRAEERQRLLLAELDHRVRNMMAVVQALARQSLKGRADDAAVFTARIAALARVHALLAENNWTGADLRAIVDGIAASYGQAGEAPVVIIDGPPLRLPPKLAQSLALVLQELSANASKYGALSAAGGRVEIDWARAEIAAGDRLVLHWRERGGPPVAPPARRGFGTRFIDSTVSQELSGSAAFDFAADGLVVTLDLPLPAVPGDEPIDPAAAPDEPPAALGVLRGRSVLVVEDEQLVAQEIAAALVEAGAQVLGPVGRPADALHLVAMQVPDLAVLDVNLAGVLVWPVAEALRRASVPILLVTGYEAGVLPPAWRDVPRLTKPVQVDELLGRLARLAAPRRAG